MRLIQPKACGCCKALHDRTTDGFKTLEGSDDLAGVYWNCSCRSTMYAPFEAFIPPGYCDCEDCDEAESPCYCDCDVGEECKGCLEARIDREDIQFEIDQAIGRR